ncbi:ribonuclease VapC [Lentzea sp. NBRC 105346]|uniref:type II toxin-antitoxin system VapC family toxin n=1 Tax=Lentzea sp. NBRC 105346 TaxID=3032205 RepID=UPI0024A135A4|nr:type II toxin-antitoxin system VapC family toxin [Lentzea sp. NBRC 105346]GLZ33528.1 ribonuclease VapC [Lentzea sp. NBRC 105346]
MSNRIVVDASVMVTLFVNQPAEQPDLFKRVVGASACAPHVIDLEILHAMRRQERVGSLPADAAQLTVDNLAAMPVVRVPHLPLVARIWELRKSITAYDAAYVALAEELDVPLVTCDAKLAGSNGHRAKIETYPVS